MNNKEVGRKGDYGGMEKIFFSAHYNSYIYELKYL